MTKPACITCGKEFSTISALKIHSTRKVPCKAPTQLIETARANALQAAGVTELEIPTGEFRSISKKFNESLSKELRMKEGIFFTPKKVRDLVYEKLNEYNVKPLHILEPSFGSGEFLHDLRRIYPLSTLTGVEKNKELFDAMLSPRIEAIHSDFMEWKTTEKYDLIVGNPPYFTVSTEGLTATEKKEFMKKHSTCMTGRPNMYVLFLYKCLHEHLAENGYLAFIIPTSLYNCSYYEPLRSYIAKHTQICYMENLDKPGFYETNQETMLLLLKKGKVNDDYIFRAKNGQLYITPYFKELNTLTKNTTTITELGYAVKTGNVVWNQEKTKLSDTGTLLIYASNINKDGLKLDNLNSKEKKQYVNGLTKTPLNGPVILVERGYGNTFRFNSVLVDCKEFYAENHLNVIYSPKQISKHTLRRELEMIQLSLKDPRSIQFVNWCIGNGMLSSTELANILPIFPASNSLVKLKEMLGSWTDIEKRQAIEILKRVV
jgi:adenine-specific DNA-methyltransferase